MIANRFKMVYYRNTAFKNGISLFAILCCLLNLNAQGGNNKQLGIEVGILPLLSGSENLGLFLKAEPKIKMAERAFIGLRLGITLNSHKFENRDISDFIINNSSNHAVISFVPTFDYYLNSDHYRSYLGIGLGIHLQPYEIEAFRTVAASPTERLVEGNVKKRLGLLLRGGWEIGKLRLGLEYTFLAKADIEMPDGQLIGTVKNSYFGLSMGKIISGRKSTE